MTERKNREQTLLLTAVFLFWFSVYTYPSFLSDYSVNTLQASKLMAGMIVGSYGFMQMLLRIPLGILSDAIKRRKLFVFLGFLSSVIASGGLSAISLIAGADAVPQWLVIGAMLFRGMAGVAASTWVTLSVMYSSYYPPEKTSLAMSKLFVPQYGSQIIAMMLGAQLAQRVGAVYAFALATLAGVAGLVLMWRTKDRPPVGDRITVKALLNIVRDRELISGTALATLLQLICWATVLGFVQNWAREICKLTTGQLGYLSVMYLLPNMLVSRVSGGVLSEKLGRARVLTGGFLLIGAACALYPFTRDLVSLLLVQALFGVGMGLISPITMSAAIRNIPDAGRGAAMGIYQAIYGLGMFLGPVLAGTVIEWFSTPDSAARGYIANFYAAAGVALIGAVAAHLLMNRNKAQA